MTVADNLRYTGKEGRKEGRFRVGSGLMRFKRITRAVDQT